MDSEENQILTDCLHCGNKGLQNVVGRHFHTIGGFINVPYGTLDTGLAEYYTHFLLSCPVCQNVSLYERYSDETMPKEFFSGDILYPRSTVTYEGIPHKVKAAFESAIKIENISKEICLIALRRTLEAICKDKNAKGKSLVEMTDDLVEKGVFPPTLKDACWIIRHLGNEAAHADDSTVHQVETKKVIGFVDTIIDYTYSLPIRIAKLKKQIESRDVIVKVDQCAEATAEGIPPEISM